VQNRRFTLNSFCTTSLSNFHITSVPTINDASSVTMVIGVSLINSLFR